MWCFTRRTGQKLRIGDQIVLTVQRIRGGSVRLGFDVPSDTTVDREEIAEEKKRERIASNLTHVAEQAPLLRDAPAHKTGRKSVPRRKTTKKKSTDHSPGA